MANAGSLRVGDRADIAIIDPSGLDDSLSSYHEEPVPTLGGINRIVRRNDKAVFRTIIGGRVAYQPAKFAPDFWHAPLRPLS